MFKINDEKVIEEKLKVQDHHLCPLSGKTKIGESTKEIRNSDSILNSTLNRTYISSVSNSVIRDKRVNEYFEYINDISLINHCIPMPFKQKYCKNDNEDDKTYYERVLTDRYHEIYNKLREELNILRGV